MNYADDGTGFRYDVKNPATPLKMGQLYPLQAMLTQASVLRQCLDSTTPWEALTQIYPELVQIQQAMSDNRDMDAHQISKHLINMYRTYVGEWQGFARNIPIATLSKEPSK
ncbi:MAG: hypothetical protein HY673_22250 [Chloroflexi bacterium]|nr:hypothetical protein [Chloroflexota bacterium]